MPWVARPSHSGSRRCYGSLPPAKLHLPDGDEHAVSQLGDGNRLQSAHAQLAKNPAIKNTPVSLGFAFRQSRLVPPRQGLRANVERLPREAKYAEGPPAVTRS